MAKEIDFYQISLKVLLKNKENKVLTLKALDGGTYAGFHDFPGGRIDKDEFNTDLLDVLAREILEEVGDIKYKINKKPIAYGRHLIPAKFSEYNEKVPVLYLFFEAEYEDGDINISHEHNGFDWVDLNSIELNEYFKSGILEGIKMYVNQK